MVEMARSLLKSMGVPATFWAEAVKTAVHILNRAPTRSLKGMTPYEAWRGKKPRVDYFRTFGCTTHMKVVGPGVTKLCENVPACSSDTKKAPRLTACSIRRRTGSTSHAMWCLKKSASGIGQQHLVELIRCSASRWCSLTKLNSL